MSAHGFGQRIARLRQEVARDEMPPLRLAQFPVFAVAHHDAKRGVANGATHEHPVAYLGAGAAHHRSFRNASNHGYGNSNWPRCAIGVTTKQRTAKQHSVAAQPLSKAVEPLLADLL